MRRLLTLLILAAAAWAQPTFVDGPKVFNITTTSAVVAWISSEHPTVSPLSQVEWGLTTGYGNTRTAVAYNRTPSGPYQSTAIIGGLTPGTTYHTRGRMNNGAVLSSDVEFTTLPQPAVYPELPIPPQQTVDTTYPTVDGNTYNVLSDCSNLPSILTTLAGLSGSATHEVVIPTGANCLERYIFPARPSHSGKILVRSSAVGTSAFPPEGVRWTPNWSVSNTLAKFTHRGVGLSVYSYARYISSNACNASAYGEGGFYGILTGFDLPASKFRLLRCSDSNPAYTGDPLIDSMTGSNPVLVGATGHGLVDGMIVYIPTNGYVTANPYVVYDCTADTFKILVSGSGSYTGGVSFTVYNQYRYAPYTESGEDPTGSCTEEMWHWNNVGQRAFWCVQGAWVRFGQYNVSSDQGGATIELLGDDYYLTGLEATIQQVPQASAAPHGWHQLTSGYLNNQGRVISMIYVAGKRITFDRCYIHGLDYPARLYKVFAVYGDHFALINSYVDNIQSWRGASTAYDQLAGSMAIHHQSGSPLLLRNNFLSAAGITYFVGTQYTTGVTPIRDATFTRNTLYKQPGWRRTSSESLQQPHRHNWEIKNGRRLLIQGNQFFHGFSGINAGADIMVNTSEPYSLPGASTISSWANGVLTLSGTSYFPPSGLIYVQGTDAQHNGLQEVAANGCPSSCTTITLTGTHSGSGSGGTALWVAMGEEVGDMDIRDNTFYNGTEIFRFSCIKSGGFYVTAQGSRFAFRNNLTVDYNLRSFAGGGHVDYGGTFSQFGDNGPRMVFHYGDCRDLVVTNNTYFGNRGSVPTALGVDSPMTGPSSGLRLSNNLSTFDETSFDAIRYSTYRGTAALDQAFPGNWIAENSVFCCGKSSSGYPATYRFPSAEADVKWVMPQLAEGYNFRLRYDSPYISGGAFPASNGGNVGVDMDALEAAQGKVGNARVHSLTATTATVGYLAPDDVACTVEYGTSATWGTGSRISDGGGARARNVPLSSLSSGTVYHARILCAVEQPTVTFKTP